MRRWCVHPHAVPMTAAAHRLYTHVASPGVLPAAPHHRFPANCSRCLQHYLWPEEVGTITKTN